MMPVPSVHARARASAPVSAADSLASGGEGRVRPNVWVTTIGLWALLGIVSYATAIAPGDRGGDSGRLLYHGIHILALGALSAGVTRAARITNAWPLWRRVGLHTLLAVGFAGVVTAATLLVPSPTRTSLPLATYELHFLAYFVVLALVHVIDFALWRRDRRVEQAREAERSARLESELALTELRILRSQLEPHFLFNTLHVISELVHVDAARADRMVTRLGDLLRMSASLARSPDVPLRDELDFVNAYLEIQQARFGGQLRVVRDVDDAALDAAVPSLLVQPLVENAIRHGTSRRAGGGQLEIIARRDGAVLVIEVLDDGPGVPADASPNEGIGIGHTRARLAQLYGDASRLELEPRPHGGTTARVRLPYERASRRANLDDVALGR